MSRTDSTQKKFDTNFPEWLFWKLVAKEDVQSVGLSRQARKRQWLREIELELDNE